MLEEGFQPDFPPEICAEAERLATESTDGSALRNVRDLRSLLWSSIDNRQTRDLDQVEYSERLPNGDIRILVGIADVDTLVRRNTRIDSFAGHNAMSVYTGAVTFPMLPEIFSADATSLVQEKSRVALITDFTVIEGGDVKLNDVYAALVQNHGRLNYEEVGMWLEGKGPPPPAVALQPRLGEQLSMQQEAAQKLQSFRKKSGALSFETVEATPVTAGQTVISLEVQQKNTARDLIESFMVAANSMMARFLTGRNRPIIERVVRTPQRWDRIVELARVMGYQLPLIPDSAALAEFLEKRKTANPARFPELSLAVVKLLGPGEYVLDASPEPQRHFSLAVQDYVHSTAPNRRYADLIIQRLVKAAIAEQPSPYEPAALDAIAHHCNDRAHAARKVERTMRKVCAALLLARRIGDIFDGIITGVKAKGTYVRIFRPVAEGKVLRGDAGLDIGTRVRVKLLATDPEKGFIDFERA